LEFVKTESPICNYKKTFLIWAAGQGRISQAEFFPECGSDVNAADTFGNTGMIYAVNNRNIDMVKLLIENNANLTLADRGAILLSSPPKRTETYPSENVLKRHYRAKINAFDRYQTPVAKTDRIIQC
jgi:ankyrin repeat protein